MAKKKIEDTVQTELAPEKRIEPIRQEFGNGDLNTLRDKINEIIG